MPGQEAKILQTSQPKHQKEKQTQCCNKFNTLKMVHIQKKSLKKDITAKFSQHQIPFQYKGKIKMNLISNPKNKKKKKGKQRG